MPGSETDDALVAAYAQGASDAARQLMERHVPRLLSFATRILGDRGEAEDVVQEAMLRLWMAAPGWQPGRAQVSTWLYRVASNLSTDRLRRRGTMPIDAVPEPADGAPGAAERMQQAARVKALETALLELPERQREAVVLRNLEGLSNPKVAAVMDLSVEAVESLIARGRRGLKAILVGQRAELGYHDD
jgi:RNA polymerase sigma-70 factor (ECF subfamily)